MFHYLTLLLTLLLLFTENVAINQPASQSDQDIVGASLAVDGDETTCSIISPDLNGISWSVEFADITPIAGVVILSTGNTYSESRERPIQTIMKVSSKSFNYLPIFFSNSMVDRKVDS